MSKFANYSVFNQPQQQQCNDLNTCRKEINDWKYKYQNELTKIKSICDKTQKDSQNIKNTNQQCQLDLLTCRMQNLKAPQIKKGGNIEDEKYYQKYLKYKAKYLNLKNNNQFNY